VLISLIVIVPVMLGAMNVAISTVHKAQNTLAMDYNDVEVSTQNYANLASSTEKVDISSLSVCDKIGNITCENAGINADIFIGANRVSLRNGVGCSYSSSTFGSNGAIKITGWASTYFKGLKNVCVGDKINLQTLWGTFTYKVESIEKTDNLPDFSNKQVLVLYTATENNAFSYYNNEKLCVIAKLVSTSSGEVQK
jgi:LPXTG-site transpeptidase (sortase) family protein